MKTPKEMRKLTDEEIKRLCEFFHLLLKADMRLHPEKYKSSNGNTERTDALPHQDTQKDQTVQ